MKDSKVNLAGKKSQRFWLPKYIQNTHFKKDHFLLSREITLDSLHSAVILFKNTFWLVKKRKVRKDSDTFARDWVSREPTLIPFWNSNRKHVWNVATQPNKTEGELIPQLINKKLVSYLYGIIQTTTGKLYDGKKLCSLRQLHIKDSENNSVEYLPSSQNVLLWVWSPRLLQHPHGSCHHHLLLWPVLSMWSRPAQHLPTRDQPPPARLLRHLPPTPLWAWLLRSIMLAAQQRPPSSTPERDLCHNLCPARWVWNTRLLAKDRSKSLPTLPQGTTTVIKGHSANGL